MLKSWKRGFDIARAATEFAIAPRRSRRVGAALFSGATLVAIGANRYGHSHPDAEWSVHAEHAALIKRQYHPSRNLILYVYRELADGTPACSRPCRNCVQLLRMAGVRWVRFYDTDGDPLQDDLKET